MLLMSTSSSGDGEAQLQQRDQALPAGEHLGLAAAVVQQADRLVERARRLVAEPGRVHAASSASARAPVGTWRGRRGSGTATGIDSTSGSGRGSWCGGHGPCTGWPATFR